MQIFHHKFFQETGLNAVKCDLDYYIQKGTFHLEDHVSNCYWFPAKFGDHDETTYDIVDWEDCYNTDRWSIHESGCHGPVIDDAIDTKDVVISSIYKGYNRRKVYGEHEDIDTYYQEVMPFFSKFLLREYSLGDKVIAVDPNGPGNLCIMTLITSRQPWEDSQFIPSYNYFRSKGFHPLLALYSSQFFKYAKDNFRYDLSSDHDCFSNSIDPAKLIEFIKTGDVSHHTSSFNEGNKWGVFNAFYYEGSIQNHPLVYTNLAQFHRETVMDLAKESLKYSMKEKLEYIEELTRDMVWKWAKHLSDSDRELLCAES